MDGAKKGRELIKEKSALAAGVIANTVFKGKKGRETL